MNLNDKIVHALTNEFSGECPFEQADPSEHYRADQCTVVPNHLRGLVALCENMRKCDEFTVLGKRFREWSALTKVRDAMICDSLELPPGTNIGLYTNWSLITVLPKDQTRYVA